VCTRPEPGHGPVDQAPWAYDLQADTWARKGDGPTDLRGAYDPVSGLVVAAPGGFVDWVYAVETDTWTPISLVGSPGLVDVFAYDASIGRMVGFSGTETWLLDLRTGIGSRGAAMPGGVFAGWDAASPPAIAYDEAAARMVFFDGSRMTAYDATADRWEMLAGADRAGSSGSRPLPRMVYDPANRRLVGMTLEGGMEALDLVTREWTVLLEGSDPAPTSQ